ncbi:MAG: hypothetical protein ACTS7D_00340 [Candidatus Hodgkinia cicadicola]
MIMEYVERLKKLKYCFACGETNGGRWTKDVMRLISVDSLN